MRRRGILARAPLLLLAGALLLAAGLPSATAQGFACTEFIGYSQMGNTSFGGWGPYAARTMVGSGPDTVEFRWQNAGATFRWADPTYVGWGTQGADPGIPLPYSPCVQNASAPDRVILDVTHNEYLTPARYPDAVGFMATTIQNAVARIKQKHPTVRLIVLQPTIGGPNQTTCPTTGMDLTYPGPHDPSDPFVVRSSYNHPVIWQAMWRVAGGDVTLGYDSQVRTCADYNDWIGHLKSGASDPIGTTIGSFYLNGGGGAQLPPSPTPPPTPTPMPTGTVVFGTPIPIVVPTCYVAVIVGDGDLVFSRGPVTPCP